MHEREQTRHLYHQWEESERYLHSDSTIDGFECIEFGITDFPDSSLAAQRMVVILMNVEQ